MDASATTAARPGVGARRAGYVVAAGVQVLVLVVLHVWPGWQAAPFLTEATVEVLPAVNASIVAGLVAQLVYVVADPPRLRAFGDVVVTAVGLVAIVTVWDVFPFTFPGQTFDWELLVRILLVLAAVGSVLAILAGLVRLVTGKG
ncbi:hypothetical protein ATJ88_2451 [Isoptericola jiangsuensis]|uniref:Uncharacterized protein n=1 Tax=Isoptericola jiangsuensis TaxID=548579 RepID=A0A2A9EXH1_9MICO|nr:hypothetical protein [Isoptericola jiangsuensis]PFG43744.1 hypothetical protein ATJ88_2451 [Isoptericola jiangsuensis]